MHVLFFFDDDDACHLSLLTQFKIFFTRTVYFSITFLLFSAANGISRSELSPVCEARLARTLCT